MKHRLHHQLTLADVIAAVAHFARGEQAGGLAGGGDHRLLRSYLLAQTNLAQRRFEFNLEGESPGASRGRGSAGAAPANSSITRFACQPNRSD